MPITWRWALQRPDLVRYNRVEALSLGVRGQVRPRTPLGPFSLTATARLGVADRVPNGRLEIVHETLRRRIAIRGYHELTPIDDGLRPFGTASSTLALTVGRDDGDYYRASGADVSWTPPTAGRRWFRVRGFVEHHRTARVETDFALRGLGDDGWAFRPNLLADRGWEAGASAELSPVWGTDPRRPQGGLDIDAQGAVGDFEHIRVSVAGRARLPLVSRLAASVRAAVGSVWGSPAAQRLWYVGGPMSLRAYDPRTLEGERFATARAQLAQGFSFGTVSLFWDLGWAGDRVRFRWGDALRSAGGGLAVLDDLVHLDAGWGLESPHPFRLDAYLDAGF